MHEAAYRAVAKRLRFVNRLRSVVELGSKNVNGSVRSLFPKSIPYTGVDVAPGPDVDVVMDAALFEPTLRPSLVVCCEVLEHAENAEAIVTNAVNILEDDGVVIITCASPGRRPHSAVDGGTLRDGEFYRNVEPKEILDWLEKAGASRVQVEYDPNVGDVYALGFKR